MFNILTLFSRYQSTRQGWSRLPAWARLILLIVALPGLLAAALSILALGVSILALLLLTSPVFRVLTWMTAGREALRMEPADVDAPRERRHVDVTIVEQP